jgi:hypothetical protein
MTAAAVAPNPVDIFVARCEAAVRRWQAGYRHLHDAIDGLQAEAVASGLVASIGQDAVQRQLSTAFAAVREHGEGKTESPRVANVDPLIAGLKLCADTQRHLGEWEKRKTEAASFRE